jgi:hypothetical protein
MKDHFIKSKPHLKGGVLFRCLLAVGLPRGGFPLGKGTFTGVEVGFYSKLALPQQVFCFLTWTPESS